MPQNSVALARPELSVTAVRYRCKTKELRPIQTPGRGHRGYLAAAATFLAGPITYLAASDEVRLDVTRRGTCPGSVNDLEMAESNRRPPHRNDPYRAGHGHDI